VTPLAQHLRAVIASRGPITFAEYMDLALYHPRHGYYAADLPRTGRSGDFVTSPEIDQAFGELWAGAFKRVWEAVGKPGVFSVIEVGPGEAGFAKAVLAASGEDFGGALRYILVEPRAQTGARQRSQIDDPRAKWASSLDEVSVETGAVFANEVLDNQPVHLVKPDSGALLETGVDVSGAELALVEIPASNAELAAYLKDVGLDPLPAPMQVGLAAAHLARKASATVERGAVFFVDYGLEAGDILERGGNSVVTYSEHGPATDPLREPGLVDITAHADWTGVRAALEKQGLATVGPLMQADVLRSLGLRTIDERLRKAHDEAVAVGDGRTAVRLLSRRNAIGALANTSGLGGLQVLAAAKDLDVSALSFLSEA
jgi:SAM-dependent MidA family methyltransferase